MIEQADQAVSQQLQFLEDSGADLTEMREMGMPTYEQYKGLRDMIANYTDGKLLLTTWRWAKGGVMPGDTAGLCVAQPEPSDAYYSCWSFSLNDDWQY